MLNDVLIEKNLESCKCTEFWNKDQDEYGQFSCPKCCSECLSVEKYRINNNRAIQIVVCHGCNFKWKDVWDIPLPCIALKP